jgi:hypothetical protein
MILDPAKLFWALIELVKGGFILAILLFLLVLVGAFVRLKLEEKFMFSWIITAIITIFAFSFMLLTIAVAYPLVLARMEAETGYIPAYFQPTLGERAFAVLMFVSHLLVSSAVLTALVLPFVVAGALLEERIRNRFELPRIVSMFVTTWLVCMILAALVLYGFRWVLLGIIYLLLPRWLVW